MAATTAKQEQVLHFIRDKQASDGIAPTYREIAAEFGFKSVNAALAHVQALITKGLLAHRPGLARSFRVSSSKSTKRSRTHGTSLPDAFAPSRTVVIPQGFGVRRPSAAFYRDSPNEHWTSTSRRGLQDIVQIPIYGSIPAGLPEDTTQENDGCVLIDVNTIGIKPTARTFALKVRGDSMIGKCIINGDIAVIEHGVEPRNNDVVAALIDGEVTLKTFVMHRGKPFLRAENPKYRDLIPRAELQIQGVMVALIRKRK